MQVGMTGGDLDGGRDPTRNADVAALKKLFYTEQKEESVADSDTAAAHLGLLRDLPVARFRMPLLLPHQQAGFNIFQPQLVHLFESLLATEPPWLYLHTHLPGGVENLGNPAYALPATARSLGVESDAPGSEAILQGTLMQVCRF